MNLIRVVLQVVEFLGRHVRCTKNALHRSELSSGVHRFEQIPHRVATLFILVRLQERAVRSEVANVPVAGITHCAKTKYSFITAVASAKNVLPWRAGMIPEE